MDENRGTTPGGNDASLRVPPHDLHAEQAVLASVLLNNDLINGVMEVLRPGDFYQGAHRILYEAMVDLYDRGRPIDQLTLSAVLKDRNAEQQVGGLAYLSEIVTSVPISANVVHYARIVKEAFYIAQSGRPGPVVIDLPKNIQQARTQPVFPTEVNIRGYNPFPKANDLELNEIIGLIEKSERPVLYCVVSRSEVQPVG